MKKMKKNDFMNTVIKDIKGVGGVAVYNTLKNSVSGMIGKTEQDNSYIVSIIVYALLILKGKTFLDSETLAIVRNEALSDVLIYIAPKVPILGTLLGGKIKGLIEGDEEPIYLEGDEEPIYLEGDEDVYQIDTLEVDKNNKNLDYLR